MNDLTIQLTGEIQDSNFDEWKSELLGQIKSVNTELKTDAHFAEASDHVKAFKKAETTLKKAKASAIKQAADINTLFEAIDTVAAETREVRLTLERQIRGRKQEIKEEYAEKGVKLVSALIDEQSDDFKLIDHSQFMDEDIFEEAIKGKASTKGLEKAIKGAVGGIEEQINEKAALVKANADKIDSLASGYQPLFQDRANLLNMTEDEIDAQIDKRIDRFKKDGGAKAAEAAPAPAPESAPASAGAIENPDPDADAAEYQLVVVVNTSEAHASKLFEKLKDDWMELDVVSDVMMKA